MEHMPAIPGTTMAEIERYAILRTLESVDWSTRRAAAVLGISTRKIQYRLKAWKLSQPHGGSRRRAAADPAGADLS